MSNHDREPLTDEQKAELDRLTTPLPARNPAEMAARVPAAVASLKAFGGSLTGEQRQALKDAHEVLVATGPAACAAAAENLTCCVDVILGDADDVAEFRQWP